MPLTLTAPGSGSPWAPGTHTLGLRSKTIYNVVHSTHYIVFNFYRKSTLYLLLGDLGKASSDPSVYYHLSIIY